MKVKISWIEDMFNIVNVIYFCFLTQQFAWGGGESLHPEGILPEFHQTLGAGKNLAGHSAGTRGKRPMAYAAGG